MKTMRNLMVKLLAVFLLSGATALAGSFTSDFSNPTQTGYTLNIEFDANSLVYPLVTNSQLLLLYNEGNVGPVSMVIDPLDVNGADNNENIDSFTASFQLQIGPGSGTRPTALPSSSGPTSATVSLAGARKVRT